MSLLEAARKGDIEQVRQLIKDGADVDQQNDDGQTALMWVAFNGHKECLRELLNAGASTDIQDKNGYTAVYLASLFDTRRECLEMLL